jgi:3-oxoacyl-[acyl-carrier-protein] synthase II
MPDRRRVVITGVGAITPIGLTACGLWSGLRAQRSRVREISRFDPSLFRSHLAAQVDDFQPLDFLEARRTRRLDRFGQFSVAAARLALEDSELDLPAEDRERVGAMMGTALGGVGYAEEQCSVFYGGSVKDVDPALALMVFGGASSCNIAIEFGVMGPNSTNAMSCASGTIAIGEAFRQIRDGYADVMLGGGAEAPLFPLCFGAFALIRAMSTRNDDPGTASRPFDRDRDGFVMGEGASVLVLEERGRAIARGARIYAEVAGFGMSNDAYHMTAPRPDGAQARRSIELALADAALPATAVDLVSAHASATPLGDRAEARALGNVFGAHTPLVFATKGLHGHALGATPAMETVLLALALARGWAPPSTNLDEPDADVALRFTGAAAVPVRARYGVKNAFGFGGINVSLVLGAPPDPLEQRAPRA